MMLTGGFISAAIAATMISVPGRAADGHGHVPRGGFGSYTSAACRPDRLPTHPRRVEKSYPDPVGDAEAGHGDIAGVWISDLWGVVTFKIDVKNLRHDLLVIAFDTNCDDHDNYVLSLGSRGGAELDRINTNDEMFEMVAPTIVRTPSHRVVGATTHTFRFNSSYFGGTSAFRFEAHVDTPRFADVSDWAPDNQDAYWYYDLLSS
jgi:hypothetical protein